MQPNSRKARAVLAVTAAIAAVAILAGGGAKADGSVDYKVVGGHSIPQPLTDKPGDPERGKEIAINRKQGNCLACHKISGVDQPFQGEVGPRLDGIASVRSEGELRLQIVNAKAFNPDTIMPAFYKADGFHRVMDKFKGKTVLSAQQVEDILAFVMTLK